MRDHLDAPTMGDLLQKLCLAFGKPFGAEAKAQVQLWFDALKFQPASTVRAEVIRWIETETRFPTIAAIIARVKASRPPTDAERQNVESGVCPVCKVAFFVAGYEVGTTHRHPRQATGKVIGRLRCNCRPVGYGWQTPSALAWNRAQAEVPHAPMAWRAVEFPDDARPSDQ